MSRPILKLELFKGQWRYRLTDMEPNHIDGLWAYTRFTDKDPGMFVATYYRHIYPAYDVVRVN